MPQGEASALPFCPAVRHAPTSGGCQTNRHCKGEDIYTLCDTIVFGAHLHNIYFILELLTCDTYIVFPYIPCRMLYLQYIWLLEWLQ